MYVDASLSMPTSVYLTISGYRQSYLWSSETVDRTLHRLEPLGFLRGARQASRNWIRTGGSAGTIDIYTLLVNTLRDKPVREYLSLTSSCFAASCAFPPRSFPPLLRGKPIVCPSKGLYCFLGRPAHLSIGCNAQFLHDQGPGFA